MVDSFIFMKAHIELTYIYKTATLDAVNDTFFLSTLQVSGWGVKFVRRIRRLSCK